MKSIQSQRGTILITVMMLFAIGAYMATEITYRQKVDIQRTSAILSQSQAYEYVLGAEEIARFALREDLKRDKDKERERDHPDEDWGMKLAQMVDGGTIEGELADLQGRFNLNWLLLQDKAQRDKVKSYLMSLMAQLKIPKDKPSSAVVDQLIDYMDEDSAPVYPDGKDDQELMLEEPPRRAANRMLFDVSELLLIPALTPEEVEILAPFVTVLPPNTPLNINSAPEEVLTSIECLDAAAIKTAMPKKGYDELDEADKISSDANCKNAKSDLPIFRDTKSEFYELKATSVVNGKIIKVRSILYRDSTQDSNIDVKVIYRRQVDPYSNV